MNHWYSINQKKFDGFLEREFILPERRHLLHGEQQPADGGAERRCYPRRGTRRYKIPAVLRVAEPGEKRQRAFERGRLEL